MADETDTQPANKPASKTERKPERARPSDGKPRKPAPPVSRVVARGAQELVDLTGKDFESIVGLHRDDGGWQVQVELTELRRVPSTTDVLGCYEVDLDGAGHLTGYRRVGRYLRGEAGGEP